MGRQKLTDGTKKKQFYYLIEERYFNALGKKRINEVLDKALAKEIDSLKKGKNPNQTNLLEQISELEKK